MDTDKGFYLACLLLGFGPLAWYAVNRFMADNEVVCSPTDRGVSNASDRLDGRGLFWTLVEFISLFDRSRALSASLSRWSSSTDTRSDGKSYTTSDRKLMFAVASPFLLGLALFGLVGLCLTHQHRGPTEVVTWAAIVGIGFTIAALSIPSLLFRYFRDQPIHIKEALDLSGVVEQMIPGLKHGFGAVRVTIRGRPVVYKATTPQQEVQPGASVTIIGIVGLDTVEVVPAVAASPTSPTTANQEAPILGRPSCAARASAPAVPNSGENRQGTGGASQQSKYPGCTLNDPARDELCDLLAVNGVGLCNTPAMLVMSLREQCANHPAETVALIRAFEKGVVAQLDAPRTDQLWDDVANELSGTLVDEQLSAANARWAVDAWGYALGKHPEAKLRAFAPVLETPPQLALSIGSLRYLFLFTAGLLLLSIGSFCWNWNYILVAESTEGEVISICLQTIRPGINQNETTYEIEVPEVKFWNGHQMETFVADGDVLFPPPRPRVGDKLSVLFLKNKPSSGILGPRWMLLLLPGLFFVASLIAFAGTYWLIQTVSGKQASPAK